MLANLGLGGDGDEIWAIQDVEHAFGVTLNKADAAGWYTVGDIWASLLKELPQHAIDNSGNWKRFCTAIAKETDVDPDAISLETRLLAPGLVESIREWSQRRASK